MVPVLLPLLLLLPLLPLLSLLPLWLSPLPVPQPALAPNAMVPLLPQGPWSREHSGASRQSRPHQGLAFD